MLALLIKNAKANGKLEELKEQLVVEKIRTRYSANEENKIIRKRLSGTDVNGDFEQYNRFVEEAIAEVKQVLGGN